MFWSGVLGVGSGWSEVTRVSVVAGEGGWGGGCAAVE